LDNNKTGNVHITQYLGAFALPLLQHKNQKLLNIGCVYLFVSLM